MAWISQLLTLVQKLFGPDQNILVLVQIYFGSIEPLKWRNISLRIIVCIYRAVLALAICRIRSNKHNQGSIVVCSYVYVLCALGVAKKHCPLCNNAEIGPFFWRVFTLQIVALFWHVLQLVRSCIVDTIQYCLCELGMKPRM